MCILFISKGIEKSELKKNTFKSETNNSIYICMWGKTFKYKLVQM